MKKKNKNKKKSPVAAVFLIMAVILLVSLAAGQIRKRIPSKKRIEAKNYFHLQSDDEVAITVDCAVSESTGKVMDGKTFLDYESIATSINPSFFYEEDTKTLIITSPRGTETVDLSGSGSSGDGDVRTVDGTLYIAEDFLEKYSDIKINSFDKPNRLVVTTDFSYVTASVSADSGVHVRLKPSIKSPIAADLSKGDTVKALDVNGDGSAASGKQEGWTHVVTEDGFVGYCRDEYLTDYKKTEEDHTSPVGSYHTAGSEEKINMVFHQTTSQSSNKQLGDAIKDVSGVNVIAPTWFFLDSETGETSSLASKAYVDTAHSSGLRVWAVLNDFDGSVNSNKSTAAALSSYKNRQTIISAVLDGLKASGADGLNIDFEKVTKDSAPDFLEFVREMRAALGEGGYVLSVDNYVPTFTSFMGRAEQARVADYVVVMCYDEHTNDSEEAGSVASLPFLEEGIDETCAEVPAAQVIAAIPFYTRLWQTKEGGTPESTSYGMADAQAAVDSLGMKTEWDEKTGQYYGDLTVGDVRYQIWMEEEKSVEEKMKAIHKRNLAGVAEWKLGFENSDIWQVISQNLQS